MRRRVTVLAFGPAIALSALVLSLSAASSAHAAPSNFVGVGHGVPLDGRDLQALGDTKIGMGRFLLSWRSVEPSQDSYQWQPINRVVGQLAAQGVRSLPFVWGSPKWVRPGPSRPPVGGAFAEQEWREFLKAAVAQYGPGGRYWAHGFRQRYPGATPLPIREWQIWNEPNCIQYFDPGQTVGHAARQYARLLQISHDAIKNRHPQAQIVLAGMLRNCSSLAWHFLSGLYAVPGFKDDFDVAALHPYAPDLEQFQQAIKQFRGVMNYHGDGATPLWLTEFSWGSAPPDASGINKGPGGQRLMLIGSFRMILNNRNAWNLRRAYWFMWRDPAPWSAYADLCSWCGSSGVFSYDRTPKPAYEALKHFAQNTAPP